MVEEAHFMLNEIREDLFIKVPVTTDGLRAIHILKKRRNQRYGDCGLYGDAGVYGGQGRCALYRAVRQPAR